MAEKLSFGKVESCGVSAPSKCRIATLVSIDEKRHDGCRAMPAVGAAIGKRLSDRSISEPTALASHLPASQLIEQSQERHYVKISDQLFRYQEYFQQRSCRCEYRRRFSTVFQVSDRHIASVLRGDT